MAEQEEDDLRGEIAKHLADMEEPVVPAPGTETPELETPETDEQKAERVRDEQGRFAKAEAAKESKDPKRETLKLKTPPAPDEHPGAPSPTTQAAAQPVAPEKIAAPQEWSGLAKVKWDKLPAAVQQEIVQREQTRMAATQEMAPLKEMFDVNREFLVNQAGSVPEAMRQMMQFARMSVDNPVALAEHILRARGIDPRQAFAGQQVAPQQAQAPDIQTYVAQLVQQAVQPFQAQAEQQQTQQLQSTIEQFASRPDRPFFNDVRVHMGQLIQAGTAKSMDEAYEQATWANPAIRAHLLEMQQEATATARAAEAQKARAATRASVGGSPIPGANLNGKGDSGATALDDVRAAYNELSGA
jgi:hypothetical protein